MKVPAVSWPGMRPQVPHDKHKFKLLVQELGTRIAMAAPQSVASEGLAQRRSEALPLNPEWVLAGSMLMVMVGEMMMVPFVLQSWTAHHNDDAVMMMVMVMIIATFLTKLDCSP